MTGMETTETATPPALPKSKHAPGNSKKSQKNNTATGQEIPIHSERNATTQSAASSSLTSSQNTLLIVASL